MKGITNKSLNNNHVCEIINEKPQVHSHGESMCGYCDL